MPGPCLDWENRPFVLIFNRAVLETRSDGCFPMGFYATLDDALFAAGKDSPKEWHEYSLSLDPGAIALPACRIKIKKERAGSYEAGSVTFDGAPPDAPSYQVFDISSPEAPWAED